MVFTKRPRDENNDSSSNKRAAVGTEYSIQSPIIQMFEGFKLQLDSHYDRRERVVKASRDITATSKKIIFSLQRSTQYGPLTLPIQKEVDSYFDILKARYNDVVPDLQGLDASRYSGTITHGNQEFVEAISFLRYVETQTLISHEEADQQIKAFFASLSDGHEQKFDDVPPVPTGTDDAEMKDISCTDKEGVSSEVNSEPSSIPHSQHLQLDLPMDDYVLGLFDLGGEIMRLAITVLGSGGGGLSSFNSNSQINADDAIQSTPRSVLDDIRSFCRIMEDINFSRSSLGYHVSKKMPVLQACVDKVERALYGMAVRGAELSPSRLREMLKSTTTTTMVTAKDT